MLFKFGMVGFLKFDVLVAFKADSGQRKSIYTVGDSWRLSFSSAAIV